MQNETRLKSYMSPFTQESEKAKPIGRGTRARSRCPGAGGGEEVTTKGHRGTSGGPGRVPCVDCGDGYTPLLFVKGELYSKNGQGLRYVN